MYPRPSVKRRFIGIGYLGVVMLALGVCQEAVQARPNIREAFFTVYPDALGTVIDTVPSHPTHCGVCHYAFGGGGQRNPYGVRLGEVIGDFPNNPAGRQQAVMFIQGEDPDNDGFSTVVEVTDLANFNNTPTFPGLTPANVGNVTGVDLGDILVHLIPTTGGDTTPPEVEVLEPNGAEVLTANTGTTVSWVATDPSNVIAVDLYLSEDGGANFRPVAFGLANTGSHTWFPANRPTNNAILRVVAIDTFSNVGHDDSDAPFAIISPPGGIVPTTLRDFDMPGSQPFEGGSLNPPEACYFCHGDFDQAVEPYFNWQGGMMAHASRDILFEAAMVVANQDAPDSGDLCLRCHTPKAWLEGRSVPTDGSQVRASDKFGVSCDFCHRLVDIFYEDENPTQDISILDDLVMPPDEFGNGMYVADPTGLRRGPFEDAGGGHEIAFSPFHREAALCGTCHNVSNPAFERDDQGNYVPNAFDQAAAEISAHTLMPIERTYSEWLYSEYNTPEGVFAPEFAGNLDPPYVSTCQDCHMRDVTGQGCFFGPVRDDLPLHDFTGGSTWMPGLLSMMYPDEINPLAVEAAIERARYMLQNAAEMSVGRDETQLHVSITNNTGHKLPTGYPEGRRMWINVKFLDEGGILISESGAYDPATGILTHDPQIKIYEAKPGLDETMAPIVGVDPGPSFHFVLNNKIFKDNRIPPRGFTNADFASFGGAPVDYVYEDGQFWDATPYDIPKGAASAEVTLYYQSTTKEYVEFLRDENSTDTKGQELFDLWNENGKSPPEIMQTVTILLNQECPADLDGSGSVGAFDLAILLGSWGSCPDCPADLDGDGNVGAADLAQLLGSWGPCG